MEKKPAVARSRTQDTSGLSRQCSATEPRQPDDHQPSQSSICTAQVVLNASVANPAATQYVPSELRQGYRLFHFPLFLAHNIQFIYKSIISYIDEYALLCQSGPRHFCPQSPDTTVYVSATNYSGTSENGLPLLQKPPQCGQVSAVPNCIALYYSCYKENSVLRTPPK